MQLEGLEAIFIIVPRDIVLKHLSVSLDPRSWQSCTDSGQLSFGGIRRFKDAEIICSPTVSHKDTAVGLSRAKDRFPPA